MKNPFWCLLATLLILSSCNANYCSGNKDNSILSHSNPKEMDYQMELSRLIQSDSGSVRYLFNNRMASSGKPILVLNVFGSGFCGDLHLNVKKEDQYSLKLQNDSGYGGSTLQDLIINFNTLGSAEYAGMTGILD